MIDYWEFILPILATVITSLASYIAVKIQKALQRFIDLRTQREIVAAVVQFVEQMAEIGQIDKEKKLAEAFNRANKWLNERGVPISECELRMLIEAAVFGFTKK